MVRARLAERYTLEDIDYQTGGPARYVRVAETGGRLGFITPLTHNFCESCNRVRLTCTGTLYMCLGQEDAADLRAPLRASESDDLAQRRDRRSDPAQAEGPRLHHRPPRPTPRGGPPHERDRRLIRRAFAFRFAERLFARHARRIAATHASRRAPLRARSCVPAECPVSSARANRRGIFALMGAMAVFSTNDMLMKLTAQRNPLGEVIMVRGVIATLIVGCIVIGMGQVSALRMAATRPVLWRTAFDGAALLLFTSALIRMPLADLSAINLVSPLIITGLAVVLFGEEVGWRRWTAIAIGFLGTLLIVKPTPANFNVWALLGIACAFSAAIRDVITRQLPATIPTIGISFMAAFATVIIGGVMYFLEDWRPMALLDVGLLAIAAALIAAGHFMIVIAFRGVDVAAIAPFRYTLLIWAGICGYLAFGELPDRYAIMGSALIVGSGLYALHREVVRRRTVAAAVLPAEPGV